VQGTAAVSVAGIYAAARMLEREIGELRYVLAGAGAAGVGIARLLRRALEQSGVDAARVGSMITVLDSRGLVHSERTDLDEFKREIATPLEAMPELGVDPETVDRATLRDFIEAVRPDVLLGTTGVPGSFDEASIRAMAAATARPIIFALSNPSSRVEAAPQDLLEWSDGRAVVATGSPFPPVSWDGQERPVGQANNVFIFPGVGLATVVAEATSITEQMFLVAARALASQVSDDMLATGAIYPPIEALSDISRSVALAVATEAVSAGVAGIDARADLASVVDESMWWPSYVPYIRLRAAVHRRAV
jgi:malic enzyme